MKKHSLFAFGIGIILFFFMQAPTSHAESGQTYKVNGSSIQVHTNSSINSDVIGHLQAGDQVVVFKESFGWAQTYYHNQVGWVASQYLSPVNDTNKTKGTHTTKTKQKSATNKANTLTVNVPGVRIRTGPGTNHNIVGYAEKGGTYTITDHADDWYKIAVDNGQTGWVASWLTDKGTNNNQTKHHSNKKATTTNSKQKKNNQSNGGKLSGQTIVVDPGHGGKDPGSTASDGSHEDKYTLATAAKVAQKLQNAGANVIQTRTNDTFISLANRVKTSENNHADAFISVHYNAFPTNSVNGLSTHYYDAKDSSLARDVQSGLIRHVSLSNRGTMRSNYHVLRENDNPAILLELGFITNNGDLSNIQTDDFQNAVGDGVADGLANYFD